MHQKCSRLAFSLLCLVAASANADPKSWEEFDLVAAELVNPGGNVVGASGDVLTDGAGQALAPSCAFDEATATALAAALGLDKAKLYSGPFRFFVQEGSTDDLVVFHSGGGACWTNNTCGSVFVGPRGTYIPTILGSAGQLNEAKGLFDSDTDVNPLAGATKVYIPYCSADVGWGNKDATYALPTGSYTVHHRGYANIRAVTEWLNRRYSNPAQARPKRVLVAGISAGGYAAIGTVLPEVAKIPALAAAKFSLIGDSANGIVSNDFLGNAELNWGYSQTLPAHMASALVGPTDSLATRIYRSSMQRYPGARFAQYQNAYDGVQSQFYNIMKFEPTPTRWTNLKDLNASLVEWTLKMRANTVATALNPAYRYYTAAGFEHGVLEQIRGPAAALLGFCSDDFATEQSGRTLAGPLLAHDWAGDMVYKPGILWQTGNWANATCFPNCLVAPLVPQNCPPSP